MNWRVGGPIATTVTMLGAAWGGIASRDQDPRLSALLWGLATLLLGVLLTMLIVAWWKDG